MSPAPSSQQRQDADKIFKEAYKRAWISLLVLCFLVAPISLSIITRVVFRAELPVGWPGGLVVAFPFVAQFYATRQVRQAGLSLDRIERHFIPKNATRFEGETIDVRVASTRPNGRTTLLVFSLVFGMGIWLWMDRRENNLFLIFGIIVFLPLTVQAVCWLFNLPLLRLDERGAFNGASWPQFWPRRIAWSQIEGVEFLRFFDYRGNETVRQLVFTGTHKWSRLVVVLPLSEFSEQQVESLVERVKAKLRGDS